MTSNSCSVLLRISACLIQSPHVCQTPQPHLRQTNYQPKVHDNITKFQSFLYYVSCQRQVQLRFTCSIRCFNPFFLKSLVKRYSLMSVRRGDYSVSIVCSLSPFIQLTNENNRT